VHALLVLAALLVPESRAAEVQAEGFYRARFRAFDTLSLSRSVPASEGLAAYAQHRLWLRPRLLLSEDVALNVEVLGYNNLPWGVEPVAPAGYGDPPLNVFDYDLAAPVTETGERPFDLTLWRAYAEVHTPIGRLTFGRVPLMWGTGIWLNDGVSVAPLFADYGDTTDRVMWERLFEDQFYLRATIDVPAERLVGVGDDTTAFGFGAAYKSEEVTAGLLLQLDHTGPISEDVGALNVFTADLSGEAVLGKLDAAVEVVGQFGGGDFETGANNQQITAIGAVLEAGLEVDRFRIQLQTGLATGDGNNQDGNLRQFTFDRDYSIGLFMFEQPMPILATADPGGRDFESAITGNAVSNALFLKPMVRMSIVDGLTADVSWLGARLAKSPEIGPLSTVQGYGNELQLGATYIGVPHFEVDARGGLFLPGGAYTYDLIDQATIAVDPAYGFQLTGRVHF
jgi:hypothetical protein